MLADYIIRTGATVRDTAKVFGVSKSTVHKDVTSRLYSFDAVKAKKVSEVLEFNLSERHLRGGNATKQKYLKLKNDSKKRATCKFKRSTELKIGGYVANIARFLTK